MVYRVPWVSIVPFPTITTWANPKRCVLDISHHRGAHKTARVQFPCMAKVRCLHHPNIIHYLGDVFVASGNKVIHPGAISIGISPRYYGQNTIYPFSLFSPYYCTVIGSMVSQLASKNIEQHAYRVKPSKTVELRVKEGLISKFSFLGRKR
jgi:hypothetical protein